MVIVIVRNCSLASHIRSAYINVWKKEGIKLISMFNGDIICVLSTNSSRLVEIISLNLSTAINTKSLLHVVGTTKRTINLSEELNYVFSISPSVVGFVTTQKEIIIHLNPGMQMSKHKNTGIKTNLKPQIVDETVRYLQVGSKQLNHLNVTVHVKPWKY